MNPAVAVMSTIIVCTIVLKLLLYLDDLHHKIQKLKLDKKHLKLENGLFKEDNMQLRRLNSLLKMQLDNQISTDIDQDIVDAIRKLMIYSHPDKGICSSSDDFIKYKKLYDRIKGGK